MDDSNWSLHLPTPPWSRARAEQAKSKSSNSQKHEAWHERSNEADDEVDESAEESQGCVTLNDTE